MAVKLRAMSAIAAICALLFGLLVFGAAHASPGEAAMRATADGASHATCHDHSFDASKGQAPRGGHENKADCPCCLAPHGAQAVLPERSTVPARLVRTASPAPYLALSATPARPAVSHGVNGARAPPSRSIS